MNELRIEVEIALSFLRAFLGEDSDDGFSDLYEDVCDSYSVIVESQLRQVILENILENINRKEK